MKQIIVDNQVTSYFIDKDGKCFNSKTGQYLKGQYSNSGYLNYNLSITPDYKKRLYAHRLVAQYFLNNGQEIQSNLEVNHKDCNKNNNNINNLEIISHKENMEHAKINQLCGNKSFYQFDKNLKIIKQYKNIEELKDKFNLSTIIQELLADKKRLTYGQYYWSYNNNLTLQDIIIFKNTGKSKIVYQYDLNNNFIAQYISTGEAARQNFPECKRASSHIGECCRGRIKTYKSFIWKYKEDIV